MVTRASPQHVQDENVSESSCCVLEADPKLIREEGTCDIRVIVAVGIA